MNRRHFLGSLAALSAGMALDVDKLLWVPGRKSYFDIVRPALVELPVWMVIEYADGTMERVAQDPALAYADSALLNSRVYGTTSRRGRREELAAFSFTVGHFV